MRIQGFFILFFIFLIGCKCKEVNKSSNEPGPKKAFINEVISVKNYGRVKNEISNTKAILRKNWNTLSLSQKSDLFTDAIIRKIIPYWYGTKWNYNGTSKVPQQGFIACGYFVTTILQDAGLHLARIKLAQCASEQMIRTLVAKNYIRQFRNSSMEDFVSKIKVQGAGVFIAGLDYHTGFIYNDGKDVYFIHSCYINSAGVIREKAMQSSILYYSKYKITGKISDDENILNKWVESQ